MAYTGEDDGSVLDWDEANANHIERHGVDRWEAEEAVLDPDRYALSRGWHGGEYRYALVGRTESGRTLTVVSVRRGSRLRVITARDASPREIRLYRRNRR
jgi:uncharacterized DUF497 family protein